MNTTPIAPPVSRRRQFKEDEDEGYERLNKKRRRVSENQEIEDRLETLIVRIEDKTSLSSSVESKLEGLASVLEADLASFRPKVLRILTECAVNMPEKCTIYSTLVGLLNTKNYNFGGEFVEHMVRNLKENLKSRNWDSARYCLRFLADLVNCHVISATSLLHLYDNFLDVLKEDDVPMVRKDWYIFAVLSSLPWVGRELFEKRESALNMLLTTIEVYINKRPKKHANILRVWYTDDPHPQEEYLDCLWAQIEKMRDNGWHEKHILRPYLAFDSILCEALQHNIPTIVPPPHQPGFTYPMPQVVFRLFDYTDCPDGPVLPGAHAIERFLIEEHMRQIIRLLHYERKECTSQLLQLSYKAKIPLEYCITEVIFSELMRLPLPNHIEIFYYSLLLELCKLQPSKMPQVLAQATELFFQRLEFMSVPCFDRLVDWFSYHLGNFKFSYSWDDWHSSTMFNPEHAQPKFVKEVLVKCVRLSYHERIINSVPPSFSHLFPERPDPTYKYGPENAGTIAGADIAQAITEAMRQKLSCDQVIELLKEVPDSLATEGVEPNPKGNPLAIDIFVQTVLFLGSKSFSHACAGIGKYYDVFKYIGADNEEGQLCILRSMFGLWHANQQTLTMLINKMLKNQILECATVANWIFSKDMTTEFTKMYVWEILHGTISKMSKHVARLNRELMEMRSQMDTRDTRHSSDSEDEEGGAAESAPVRIKTEDKVTNEMCDKAEEKLEAAQADQKNLFLIIFQRFIMILSEHLVRCDTDGISFENYWYKWTIGRLKQVFLTHHEHIEKYISTLETLLFTADLDKHILEVFQQFVAIRS